MALTKAKKIDQVDFVANALAGSELVIVVKNEGLTVAQVSDLRRKARAAGAGYKVAKNRLVKRAISGTTFEPLGKHLTGPTALAYSKDPIAAAKCVVDFAKTNEKLLIIGGAYGEKELDVKSIQALATLPSLDELRAKIVGMLQTPATRIACVLQAPGGQVARVIAAHANKN